MQTLQNCIGPTIRFGYTFTLKYTAVCTWPGQQLILVPPPLDDEAVKKTSFNDVFENKIIFLDKCSLLQEVIYFNFFLFNYTFLSERLTLSVLFSIHMYHRGYVLCIF